MKSNMKKILILCFVVFFSCEADKSVLENHWVLEIDSQIKDYEKNQIIKKQFKNNLDQGAVLDVTFYEENKSGISKITSKYTLETSYSFSQNLYLKDNEILFSCREWFSPLIYKSRKKVSDPCCSVSETKSYFFSKDSILNLERKKKINSVNDFTSFDETLDLEPLLEKDNTGFDYEYYKSFIEEMNERFPIEDQFTN